MQGKKDLVGVARKVNISSGDDLTTGDLPAGWPKTGEVSGSGVKMSYRDGPLVLKGIDFDVLGSEKIGTDWVIMKHTMHMHKDKYLNMNESNQFLSLSFSLMNKV